jgi:hypothetical protein
MLFQIEVLLLNVLWLALGTIILSIIVFLLLFKLESKEIAFEKKYMIILASFIITLILPLFLGVISILLQALGDFLIILRFDYGGNNYIIQLASIFGLILILMLDKYLLDITWDKSLLISLLTLLVLYIIYSLIPEFYQFIGFGLSVY